MSNKWVEAKLNEAVAPWGKREILWETPVDPKELSEQRLNDVLEYAVDWGRRDLAIWALGADHTTDDEFNEILDKLRLKKMPYALANQPLQSSEVDALLNSSTRVLAEVGKNWKALHKNNVDPLCLEGRISDTLLLRYICHDLAHFRSGLKVALRALDVIDVDNAKEMNAFDIYGLVAHVSNSRHLNTIMRLAPQPYILRAAVKSPHFDMESFQMAIEICGDSHELRDFLLMLSEHKPTHETAKEAERLLAMRKIREADDTVDLLPLAGEARNARRALKRSWNESNLERVLEAERAYRCYSTPLDLLYKELGRSVGSGR